MMTVKEYLEQPYEMKKKIDLKLDKLAMLQVAVTKMTASYSATKGVCNNYKKMERDVVKIADLKEEIRQDIVALTEIEDEVEKTIGLLKNETMELILTARYIYYEGWEEIARDTSYSISFVYKNHRKALKIIETMI